MGLIINIKHVTKETGPKIGCFAGFCNHHLATTSMHINVYCYPLFKSGIKTGLWTITVCTKDIALLCKNKEQQ